MAEGWARHLHGECLEPYSAGANPASLNLDAVRVMNEAGVDISQQCSKHVNSLVDLPFDFVVTVCDDAHESCPIFPAQAIIIHHPFDDPPRLARAANTEDERLAHYRRVRDEIRRFVETLPETLAEISARKNSKEACDG